jgi:hypothetical protein
METGSAPRWGITLGVIDGGDSHRAARRATHQTLDFNETLLRLSNQPRLRPNNNTTVTKYENSIVPNGIGVTIAMNVAGTLASDPIATCTQGGNQSNLFPPCANCVKPLKAKIPATFKPANEAAIGQPGHQNEQ